MEKGLPDKKPSPNPHYDTDTCVSVLYNRDMVHDFLQTCNTYDKDIYNREYFKATPCPACPAVGRFKMHGFYQRHAIYFEDNEIVCELMKIKRIICESCKTTHAILPCDIIPYKAITLLVFMYILTSCYLRKEPVLKIAGKCGFSFQLIYTVILAFLMHKNNISQHLRELYPEDTPAVLDESAIISLVKKPYIEFQLGYIEKNLRTCFMCKFFYNEGAPPIGIHAP